MRRTRPARTNIQRQGTRRALEMQRRIAEDIRHAREDAGLSVRRLAPAAGVSHTTLLGLEDGTNDPTTECLARISTALGMDLSIRLFHGTGPLVRDHLSAAMIGALLRPLHPTWRPTPEVAVHRPVRGVSDLVLEAPEPPIVAVEAHSELRRLEQQVRWSRAKADALGEARGAPVSRLLLLRSTARTRTIAAEFGAFLMTGYPARQDVAVAALQEGIAWPGDAIVWCRVDDGTAAIMDGPPRGVRIGR